MLNGFDPGDARYGQLLELLGPEGVQSMLDAGSINLKMAQAQQQAARGGKMIDSGEGMMQTPGAQGMRVGNTYVASSPLEHLSVAMARAMGADKAKSGGAMQDQANAAQTKAMADLMEGQRRLLYGIKGLGEPQYGPEEAPPVYYGPGY